MSKNLRDLSGVLCAIVVAILLTPRMNLAKTNKMRSEPQTEVAARGGDSLELQGSFDDEVLKSNVPVVVDFYAKWCGPCKNFGPIFHEVSQDPAYAGKVKFVKVEAADRNRSVTQQQRVQGLPTLVLYNNGQEVTRKTGSMSKERFENLLNESFNL